MAPAERSAGWPGPPVGEEAQRLRSGLGAELRQLREAAGLSTRLLAARTGVSRRMVRDLEGGARRPRVETLRRLAGALAPNSAERVFGKLVDLAGESVRPDTARSLRQRRRAARRAQRLAGGRRAV
ncbi:hypothetical protein CcI49_17135 [Frankia sp. CcI49]|nr:hypothetical protein CcI49_17135 [Frankia sp. CcI49]